MRKQQLLAAAWGFSLFALPAVAQCPQWSEAFHLPGVDGSISAARQVDLGNGPVLVVAGDFDLAGKVAANNIAAWDGQAWSPLGEGLPAGTVALQTFDDGNGPRLYAAGVYGDNQAVARFEGGSWTMLSLAGGASDMVVFDDGTGERLVLSGGFLFFNSFQRLVQFDGSSFVPLGGNGFPSGSSVDSLEVWDDGGGSALYAGGSFRRLGTPQVEAESIARWDGSAWSALGSGIDTTAGFGSSVRRMVGFDDGSGPALYATGAFTEAGGLPVQGAARWRNGAWEAMPSIFGGTGEMTIHNDGSGEALYFGLQNQVARWGGSDFLPLVSSQLIQAGTLASFDDGSGAQLWAGCNEFTIPNALTFWDGTDWRASLPTGSGLSGSQNGAYLEEVRFQGSTELWASGPYALEGSAADGLGLWDGAWRTLPGAPRNPDVRDLIVFDDGNGEAIFACGRIELNEAAFAAARYDGFNWHALPAPTQILDAGLSLEVFDEGQGPRLFMGRNETGGPPGRAIQRWDGTQFTDVGGGLDSTAPGRPQLAAMVTHDDGTGPALYCAGSFDRAGGLPVNNIARWDGHQWSDVGGGLPMPVNSNEPTIRSLAVYDPGTGPLLVAGGRFEQTAAGQPMAFLAAWDGQSWSDLGAGLTYTQILGGVFDVHVHDRGQEGQHLYISGRFQEVDGQPATGLARFDGSKWHVVAELGGGVEAFRGPRSLASFDDGNGRALYISGAFSTVDGVPSARIARLGDPCGPDLGVPYCSSSANSTGETGLLRARGERDVSAADIELSITQLPSFTSTLPILSFEPGNVPFGQGRLCLSQPIVRIQPVAQADAQGHLVRALDFQAPYAQGFLPGARLHLQAWFRDPAGGPSGFDLTDALYVDLR